MTSTSNNNNMPPPRRRFKFNNIIIKYFMPYIIIVIVLIIVNNHIIQYANANSQCPMEECSRHHHAAMLNPQMHRRQKGQRGDNIKQNSEYCSLLNSYHHCMRAISKPCRGTLEYHTVVSLVKRWLQQHNCTGVSRTQQNVKSGANYNLIRQQQAAARRERIERERMRACFLDAYNYTVDPENFKARIKLENKKRWHLFRDESNLFGTPNRSSTGGVSTQLSSGRSSIENSFSSESNKDVEDGGEDESGEADNDNDESEEGDDEKNEKTSPTESNYNADKSQVPATRNPQLTCLIYGDPHIRTLSHEFHTCRCVGAWPLIDHPLFAVQITNTAFKNRLQSTGITKVTIIAREFKRCNIKTDLVYEAETTLNEFVEDKALPVTFIDGSTTSPNNLIQIIGTSNDLITVHLNHIGVRIVVSQSRDAAYLNVVIKFDSNLSNEQQGRIMNAISSTSLCKSGCPQRERIEIKSLLQVIGLDIKSAERDELTSANNPSPNDPCAGLYGYYRLSCLYDVRMKGITADDVQSVHTIVQNYDDVSVVKRSFLDSLRTEENNKLDMQSRANYLLNGANNIRHNWPSLTHILFMTLLTSLFIT